MKLKTKLLIGSVLIVCAGCILLFLINVKDPVEQVVQTLLDEHHTNEERLYKSFKKRMSPELENFLSWYGPMVMDASPEVHAVMKKFDARFRSGWANRNEEIEQRFPTDEWIQRLLDMGIAINNYSNYSGYLNGRWKFYHAKNDPEELSALKDSYGLDVDASWDEVLETGIRFGVKLHNLTDQAIVTDPWVYGGSLSKHGVFIPMRLKTVYIQSSTMTAGTGVPDWVPHEIRRREQGFPPSREIPDDIDIIYLDENGQPLSEGKTTNGGDNGEVPAFRNSEADTILESIRERLPSANDFDNSFEEDFPPDSAESFEFDKPNLPQSMADLEKQLTPELPTAESVETQLKERLSLERFDKAQKLIDQYGSEEGLRRLRKSDPGAAQQFEREHLSEPSREVPGKTESSTQ